MQIIICIINVGVDLIIYVVFLALGGIEGEEYIFMLK